MSLITVYHRLYYVTLWSKAVLVVQLEYAALDAAVLIHIFNHLSGQGHDKLDWKSYIVSDDTTSLPFIVTFLGIFIMSIVVSSTLIFSTAIQESYTRSTKKAKKSRKLN